MEKLRARETPGFHTGPPQNKLKPLTPSCCHWKLTAAILHFYLSARTLTQEDPGDNQITLEEILQMVMSSGSPSGSQRRLGWFALFPKLGVHCISEPAPGLIIHKASPVLPM